MIWIPVAFCLVAVLGSLGYAGFRGYRLWRTSKAVSKCATHLIAGVSASAARVEERAVGLSAKSERLAVASAGLRRSLDELASATNSISCTQVLNNRVVDDYFGVFHVGDIATRIAHLATSGVTVPVAP